jgi:argininosuccinate lyase
MMTQTRLETASYIVSPRQVELDTAMLPYDVWGTQAHALMLRATGILPPADAALVCRALLDIADLVAQGEFSIDPTRGAQLSLEAGILARAGQAAGSRVHTARSRNDQVMVTELLYLRDRVLALHERALGVIDALLALATEHVETIMPGYTHMQPAKPTTLGQWALAHADGLRRGVTLLEQAWDTYDTCPLGAVESYGTSWPIDRVLTAELLGFACVWEVPQDAIGARGLAQLAYLDGCKLLTLSIGKLAQDLLLFTTWEYGYIELGSAVAQRLHPITGSSVMAQKKNPDALELLRATAPEVAGLAGLVANLLSNLPMGYNRDSREVKEWVALGFDKTEAALSTLGTVLTTLQANTGRMAEAAAANYSATTDLADALAQQTGVGYRQMYAIIGGLVDHAIGEHRPLTTLTAAAITAAAAERNLSITITDTEVQAALDPQAAIARRTHIGGAAPAEMARLLAARTAAQATARAWATTRQTRIATARAATHTQLLAASSAQRAASG